MVLDIRWLVTLSVAQITSIKVKNAQKWYFFYFCQTYVCFW